MRIRVFDFIFKVISVIGFICAATMLMIDHFHNETTYSDSYKQDLNRKVLPALSFCYEQGHKKLNERINEQNQTDLIEQVLIRFNGGVMENITKIIKKNTVFSFSSGWICFSINLVNGKKIQFSQFKIQNKVAGLKYEKSPLRMY